MVVSNFPNIFQQKINDLFQGFEFICVHIDNLLVFLKLSENITYKNCNLFLKIKIKQA